MNRSTIRIIVRIIVFFTCAFTAGAAGTQEGSSGGGVEFNETGYPIIEPGITLRVYSSRHISHNEEYADKSMVKDMEKKSNVHIEWEYQPHEPDQRVQKLNLMFASGDLPDIIIGSPNAARYGVIEKQLITLNDYMKYAVNLRANIYPEVPGLEDQLKFLDGNIYGLPQGEIDADRTITTMGLINKKWLDTLGMKVPENLDELYAALKAFKENDPNGNGKPDEIPTSFLPNHGVMGPNFLKTAFGVIDIEGLFITVDQDGQVYNSRGTFQFKEYIKFMNTLYNDGLLDPESLVQDKATYRAKIGSGKLGFGNDYGPHVTMDYVDEYIVLGPFVAPDGNRYTTTSSFGQGLLYRDWGAVSVKCKYPAVAVRWMDMFYDDEINFQNCFGIHSVKVEDDGRIVTLPPPEGISGDQWVQKDTILTDALRFKLASWSENVYIDPKSNSGLRRKYMPLLLPHRTNYIPSTLLFSEEDTLAINELETEIQNVIRNKTANWILEGGVENEWEQYLAELKRLGIDKYVAIYQKAYDHWTGK